MGYDQVLRSGAFLRMFRTVPISLCLLGAGALHAGRTDASSLAGLQGSWYVCAESQAIFRIDLTKEEAWSASLLAPSEYLTDGEDFFGLRNRKVLSQLRLKIPVTLTTPTSSS